MTFSIISVISRKPMRFRKKAYTAISLAAFSTHGRLPPDCSASMGKCQVAESAEIGFFKRQVVVLAEVAARKVILSTAWET
jgi:hypothetical protein